MPTADTLRRREEKRLYYLRNKERITERNKRWATSHRIEKNLYKQEWRKRRKALGIDTDKAYRKAHPYSQMSEEQKALKRERDRQQYLKHIDRRRADPKWMERNREHARRYAKNNRAKCTARSRAYRHANPAKARAMAAAQKARRRNAPLIERNKILKWVENWHQKRRVICYWCGREFAPKDCRIDHIVPLSRGGEHRIENLVVACQKCNSHKSDIPPEVWNKKLDQPVLILS